jgi:tyrosyl-tRNA synthetase
MTIMGRDESDSNPASHIFYPCMQCADIFFIGADIAQLGMDQRKVNMLAREYCSEKVKKGNKQERNRFRHRPVILSHHMLLGLLKGQEKMSKSDPNSAIFMEDTKADVKRKLTKAFCPPNVVEKNPCMDYMKHIVFRMYDNITLMRNGGDKEDREYDSYDKFDEDYVSGEIHPNDLKHTLNHYINEILEPTRPSF